MAPTTRTAARRLDDSASAASPPTRRSRRVKRVADAQPTIETGYLIDDHCRLLELPAELRNEIYSYTLENLDHLTYAPPILRKAAKPWNERTWKFFGLTQTCKQIRLEHRPIWLSNLRISSHMHSFRTFSETFFPDTGDLKHSPKCVQIVWDRGLHDRLGERYSITSLLGFNAHSLCTKIHFVPWKLLMNYTSSRDICWYCIEEMEAEDRGDTNFDNLVEECTCAPDDLDSEEWEDYQYELIDRTGILLSFIRHRNAAWLNELRNDKVDVQCIFAKSAEPITFRILCKEKSDQAAVDGDMRDDAGKALELLKAWGMFDLPLQDEMSFVLAFSSEEISEKDGLKITSSELREVRIERRV